MLAPGALHTEKPLQIHHEIGAYPIFPLFWGIARRSGSVYWLSKPLIFHAFEFVSAAGVFYRPTISFVQEAPSRKHRWRMPFILLLIFRGIFKGVTG
jgi:hypothetical protein